MRLGLGERKIRSKHCATAFGAFRPQREQDLHLFTALLSIADVADNKRLEESQLLDPATEIQIPLRMQQVLH